MPKIYKPTLALPPQHKSLLFLLQSCSSVKKALQIHAQLFISGFHKQSIFLSSLIHFFCLPSANPSSLSYALLIFNNIQNPSIFIYNTLIHSFARSQTPLNSISLYKSMLSKGQTSPNRYTFPCLVKSCSKLSSIGPGLQVHCHVLKYGVYLDVHVRNSILGLYCCSGDMLVARELFDDINKLDICPFNIMIHGHFKAGEFNKGLQMFKDLVESGLNPNDQTFGSMFMLCSKLNDSRSAKLVHMLALKKLGFNCCLRNLKLILIDAYAKLGDMKMAEKIYNLPGSAKWIEISSSMVFGYAKCGDTDNAFRIFSDMPKKDLISWTTMISGYCRNKKYKEAIELYKQMEKDGIKPDVVTLVAVLSACAHLGGLKLGEKLHLYIGERFPSHKNSNLYTAVIDMYAKCGRIGRALEVFEGVGKEIRTTSMFNSIISGLAQHRHGEKAISVFKQMKKLNFRPDEITFVGVLCACSHSGLVKEGKEYFKMMTEKYGIEPEIEHHGCMIDLLGRHGCLNEAHEYINRMGIRPGKVIWANLLRNSLLHNNAEIGKIAERELQLCSSNSSIPKLSNRPRLSQMFMEASNHEKSKNARKIVNHRCLHNPQRLS